MNILSIDFDYFQNITKEQLPLFPDGIDHRTEMSEIIWGCHYASDGDAIRKIGIMQEELDMVEEILLEQNSGIPVMIANSHVCIYDFINEHLSRNEMLGICNLDMHHDIVNDNDNLDCGNWIGYILKERKDSGEKTAFQWVHNPISLSVYGIEEEMRLFGDKVSSSLDNLRGKEFDAIFLCRSDTWTPPHLDKYFSELCGLMKEHFNTIKIEKGIDIPRKEYLEIEKQIRKSSKICNRERNG